MRRRSDLTDQLAWMSDPVGDGWTVGYDESGWPASTWVLHAMWEHAVDHPIATHHQRRQRQVADGVATPLVINGVNLDAVTVTSGGALGYQPVPEAGWRRLWWGDQARRMGVRLDDQPTPPSFRWFPTRSWPENIEPPPEGSLDETSLRALLAILTRHSPLGSGTDSFAFYSVVAHALREPVLFSGSLGTIPGLVPGPEAMRASPSNFWPADHSWFVFTDTDSWATRVSGPAELIAEITEDSQLEALPDDPGR